MDMKMLQAFPLCLMHGTWDALSHSWISYSSEQFSGLLITNHAPSGGDFSFFSVSDGKESGCSARDQGSIPGSR